MKIKIAHKLSTPVWIKAPKFQGDYPLGILGNSHSLSKNLALSQIGSWVWFIGSLTGWFLINNSSLKAQITPDSSLGTQVNSADNITEITGGVRADSNLFHSFQDFSVATDNSAFFNNASDISNIIGRVTGGNISNIDGLIRANGNANLILINPNGINFGANASLDIGGSFLGSSADSVIFEDGTVFSTRNTQAEPMLTIRVPVGLQLGQNPAAINVEGTGHNLSLEAPIFSPFTIGEVAGLEVQPGRTLALVGGNLNINGGTLTAKEGRIELGSVAGSIVDLNPIPQGWELSYDNSLVFQDISFSQKAFADASGINSGSIQVQGKQVSLQDGSAILIQNQGDRVSGNLVVNASESLEINGTTADGGLSSGLFTEALGSGSGGELEISTQQLTIRDGGVVLSSTFSDAEAGYVTIDASESLQILGFSAVNPSRFSIISGQTFGSGKAGDISISTTKLTALDGGNIASVTGGITSSGSGGQVNINASESVELIGVTPGVFTPSQITAGTGSAGDAGDVTIDTQQLVVRDGGRVDASTTATGNAGSVTINATDSVEVSGTVPGSINPSLIISSANILDPALQQLLRLPPVPSGNSGDIQINTSQLSITDGALITARNDGLGNSGSVRIDADSIYLNNDSGITSEIGMMPNIFLSDESSLPGQPSFGNNFSIESPQNSENVQGGGIDISTQQLVVETGATISTNTFTNYRGGNITIDAAEDVRVQGFSAVNPSMLSFISTSSFGTGDAGDLNLSTEKLTILDGGRVGAGTLGVGLGGDINVKATELIEVIGAEPSQAVASLLGASSLGAGDAGNLTIDTTRLVARDGGRVDSSAAATGSAGNVNIQASESIEISGTVPGSTDPSLISSGANIEDELAQQILRLPALPSGNAGNVTIKTGVLKITDRAEVSVVNEGLGDAGTLEIDADSIMLDNQGSLSAATRSGVGGDITLSTKNVFLQGNSTATARAAGIGNGGNIRIDADNVVVLEASQVIADAFMGMGGNIQIDTQGLFICGECQISASSRLGIDGQVNIETLQPDPQLEVVDLPQQPAQKQEEVAVACPREGQSNTSELTFTGRGGLPPRPQEPLSGESIIAFDTPIDQTKQSTSSTSKSVATLPAPARGWYTTPQGKIVLTSQVSGTVASNSIQTTSDCHVPRKEVR
ncbi:filamentous hemagglutinin N-terminal domain-containing protein [Pleurocapsa sp. PCC 7319]|uniref:two-partner secretion domain-containing protein n=1 Tax=Pleurocapsa sp. PCC 7319 TaxID=118161 RepID=UPI0003469FFC|nr:filamentous hemagglutinin N-terminal domain-containing protein [Pleurocapsa sp. PCC 7319]